MTSIKSDYDKFPIMLTEDDLGVLVHGADWNTFGFQVMEDDNSTPIDTTDWTCDVYLLESENGEQYAHLTNGSGVVMTAASGLFTVEVAKATVDTWNFRTCLMKVIVTDDDDNEVPYFLGRLRFVEVP